MSTTTTTIENTNVVTTTENLLRGVRPPQTTWIPFERLKPHPQVERELDLRRVNEIADDYNPALLGIITVSRHPGGVLWILDGMHRWAAAIQAGHGRVTAECHVYEKLSVPEEAALFRGRNNTKRLHPMDLFRADVLAGDTIAVACDALVRRFHLIVARNVTNGFTAVVALRRAYQLDPVAAERALHVATGAWGVRREAVEGPIVDGLAQLAHRYDDTIAYDELIKKLAKMGEPGMLIGRAKTYAEIRSMRVASALAAVTIDLYNQRRRKPVDPW